ncbi:general secretion pathway protein GspD [Massilia arenosa]|uniref:General secretion pathway protein GspD n=1 Tax=Zemynaea arenosa TaxID=2561931 RepID=A0A4Y9SC49_9BURK|nr:secretin N-terminal domain-containing protein [Massilia arenosa]TFW17335.1 general secretion pathway protein GspD [Massilia arenosa]
MKSIAILVAGAVALAACSSPEHRDTYDKIKQEVAKGATQPASAASLDDAVNKALLPPPEALASQLPKARPALEERFNVAFNNVPAQQFFNSLVAGTRYNMLVAPDVSGHISANLKDVTITEALDAIRELYGYDYRIDGTRIYIKPLTMQTKMFKVNYLVGQRNGVSNTRVASTSVGSYAPNNGSAGSQNQSLQGGGQQNQQQNQGQGSPQQSGGVAQVLDSTNVSTGSRADFWQDLRTALEAIVGNKDGRSVVISPQSGVIIVKAMPGELRDVGQYLQATQLAVERQVILEAKILEVELNENFQSGINWASFASISMGPDNRVATGFVQPGAGLTPLPFAGGQPPNISNGQLTASTGFSLANAANSANALFGLALQTNNFAALISLLESQGTVHVLSSPRIATVNNQKAVLKIGTDEFYVVGIQTTTNSTSTGNVVTPSVTVAPFFSGVVLDVTPQIDERGNILLHVHPSVSQVTTVTKQLSLGSMGNLTLPLAASNTSEIDSVVRGQDGHVVAIGGLMRQATNDGTDQVPGVGNVPVLGNLFKNKSRVSQKRELVVLIKPTIVDASADWNSDLLEAGRRIDQLDPKNGRIR